MATATLRKNSLNAALKEMEKCLEDQLKKDLARHKAMVSQSVLDLDVEDTGETARETTVELILSNPNVKIIRGYTPFHIEQEKAVYPFFGLGTSRRYGPRNWFALWNAKVFEHYGIKDGRLPNPNTTFRKR